MPAVGANVTTKCRDLVHDAFIVEYTDGPECNANGNSPRKKISYLLRARCSRQIPVEMRMPEQRITNSSPYAPRLEASFLERARDLEH